MQNMCPISCISAEDIVIHATRLSLNPKTKNRMKNKGRIGKTNFASFDKKEAKTAKDIVKHPTVFYYYFRILGAKK